MNITVIVCTYNRCQLLPTALKSVAASILPGSLTWEVIVVDNNSSDQTREVAEVFCRQYTGRFRYLFEPNAGKSHALNAGVQASHGEVLAFMDDDVSVAPTWLQNLIAPLLGSLEWSGSGGPVILNWSGPPPNWLALDCPYSMAPLASFRPGDQATQLKEPPFGANMAFRKSMFDKYGLFRTDLGPSPRPDIPRPNEDTEFGRRLMEGGECLRYEPSAVVYHPVPEDRLQKEYFRKWWFDKGRADVREFGNLATAINFRGVPFYLYRRLAVWTVRWMLAMTPSGRFDRKLKVWGKLGEIRESRDQFRHKNSKKKDGASGRRSGATRQKALGLKAGNWVEVRCQEEILATLDEHSRLENLPFMPEMLQYCGQKFRVFKRADKTCEYTRGWSIRRMKDTVHLEGLRCDGQGHDGCQAGCSIFWKEAWLKHAEKNVILADALRRPAVVSGDRLFSVESLFAASHTTNSDGAVVYTCQATDVPKFTSHMSFWDPRQYIRDLRSGNLKSGLEGGSREQRALELILAIIRLFQAVIIGFFNEVQARRRGSRYPFIEGTATRTPIERLDLQPGELVEIRSKEDIMLTLDKDQRNRGLWFDSEMLPYCGGIYRVLRRVNRIIDEKTGKLITMKTPCVVLEGVVCKSHFHRLCPRAIYPYWRENWLKRATVSPAAMRADEMIEVCKG